MGYPTDHLLHAGRNDIIGHVSEEESLVVEVSRGLYFPEILLQSCNMI